MKGTSGQGNRGLSVRSIHLAMIVCAIAVAGLLIYSTYRSSGIFSTLSQETGVYVARQKASHELMEASDYLTEMVQRFTLEGDTRYLDAYFEEAFVSKRREAAITSMSEGDGEGTLVRQLQEAMNESQALMYREYYAMKLVLEARGIQDYPETLKAVELKEADEFLPEEEKTELARSMVMGSEYYASKEIIRTRLKENLEALDDMMNRARKETSAGLIQELTGQRIIAAVLTAALLALIAVTARLSTMPLMNAARSIRAREKIRAEGSREFRELAESYNEMYESLQPHPVEKAGNPEAGAAEQG